MRAACAVLLVLGAMAPRPAAAQRVYEAEATADIGYSNTITPGTTIQSDPTAEPADVPTSVTNRFFADIRPAIAVSSGTPRLMWRAAYLFSGNLTLDSSGSTAYNNAVDLSLDAQATKFTIFTLNAAATQGSTTFLLTSRSAEQSNPEFRAPGSPSTIGVSFGQGLTSELTRQSTFHQSLVGSFSSPQDDTAAYSGTLGGTLGVDHERQRDSIGIEARSVVSRLQPLQPNQPKYTSETSGLLARYNRDLTRNWNAIGSAGVEQVYTDTGSKPLVFTPAFSVFLNVDGKTTAGGVEISHGAVTNIQVGTVSLTDKIAARGVYTLDLLSERVITASAGFLHNSPIGEAESTVAAGTGFVAQADVGFVTRIHPLLLFNARYSAFYQFDQGGGIQPTLNQILLVGVTARYSSFDDIQGRDQRRRSGRGQRVDRSDGLFPVVDEEPVNADQ